MNPFSRTSTAALTSLLVTLSAVGCGSDSSTGPHTARLSIAAGGGQSDTILAALAQPLVMQGNAPGGGGGHVMQFTSIIAPLHSENPADNYYAYVHLPGSSTPTMFAEETVSSVGRPRSSSSWGRGPVLRPSSCRCPTWGSLTRSRLSSGPETLPA
jgi:hypothetical protein